MEPCVRSLCSSIVLYAPSCSAPLRNVARQSLRHQFGGVGLASYELMFLCGWLSITVIASIADVATGPPQCVGGSKLSLLWSCQRIMQNALVHGCVCLHIHGFVAGLRHQLHVECCKQTFTCSEASRERSNVRHRWCFHTVQGAVPPELVVELCRGLLASREASERAEDDA